MRRAADERHLIRVDEAAVRLLLFHELRSSRTVAIFTLRSLIEVSRARQHHSPSQQNLVQVNTNLGVAL